VTVPKPLSAAVGNSAGAALQIVGRIAANSISPSPPLPARPDQCPLLEGIVTAWRIDHGARTAGECVMVYPVVPSMNEAERDSKYLEARDFGKPLRRFRGHQS
jgi:hypothetical protein